MTSRFRTITCMAVALLACGTPTGGCSCSPPRNYEATLVGVVISGNGPVVDAEVTAAIFSADCQAASREPVYAQRHDTVDSNGHYRFFLQTRRPDTLCARLVAHAGTDSVVRDQVPVITPGTDSVHVDFLFP